jgi:hypothetical protein
MLKRLITLAFLTGTTVDAILDYPFPLIEAIEAELPDLLKLRGVNAG